MMSDYSFIIRMLKRVSNVYCLCRLPSSGQMIGCDRCEDWYHVDCLGLTPVQVRKRAYNETKWLLMCFLVPFTF